MRRLRSLILLLLAMVAAPAFGAPCAGFTDVDDTSAFCPNVEWLKNRAITLGCTSATLYCPGDAVSRLAMAAFMNRLGTALTPIDLAVSAAPGAIDLDANSVVCQTGDYLVTGYPRRALLDLALAATATADANLGADLVKSTNGGTTWTVLTTQAHRGYVPADRWGSLANLASTDLAVGESVRFGVRMSRGGLAGTVDLADSRCQLRAQIVNRNGATSPF